MHYKNPISQCQAVVQIGGGLMQQICSELLVEPVGEHQALQSPMTILLAHV